MGAAGSSSHAFPPSSLRAGLLTLPMGSQRAAPAWASHGITESCSSMGFPRDHSLLRTSLAPLWGPPQAAEGFVLPHGLDSQRISAPAPPSALTLAAPTNSHSSCSVFPPRFLKPLSQTLSLVQQQVPPGSSTGSMGHKGRFWQRSPCGPLHSQILAPQTLQGLSWMQRHKNSPGINPGAAGEVCTAAALLKQLFLLQQFSPSTINHIPAAPNILFYQPDIQHDSLTGS